jgi:DNA-binding NarL/FixJ family response regulator
MAITVAIIEDNEEICAMLARVIAREPKLNCIRTCSSGEIALEVLPKNPPQVVIMDIQLPGISGIQCTSRLRQVLPDIQVLVYTVYGDNQQVFKALKAGASGYLLKRSTPAEILEAIIDVHQGGARNRAQSRPVIFRAGRAERNRATDTAAGGDTRPAGARIRRQGNRPQARHQFRHRPFPPQRHLRQTPRPLQNGGGVEVFEIKPVAPPC